MVLLIVQGISRSIRENLIWIASSFCPFQEQIWQDNDREEEDNNANVNDGDYGSRNGHYNDVMCVFEMMKADLLMEVWLANMRPDTLWEEET